MLACGENADLQYQNIGRFVRGTLKAPADPFAPHSLGIRLPFITDPGARYNSLTKVSLSENKPEVDNENHDL
jgi:hypothetical protein